MNTTHKIRLYTGILVGIMSVALLGSIYYEVSRIFYRNIQHQQESSMRVAREQLDRLGGPLRIVGGKLVAGRTVLNGDLDLVDRIAALVGGTATVFQGDLRIATNIRLPDSSRAVGTRLMGPAREALFVRGEEGFRGVVKTLGEPYLTANELLYNEDGGVVGMLQVGVLRRSYSGALQSILVRSFIIVVLGMLILGVLVHRGMSHLTHELEVLGESRKMLLNAAFSGIFGVDANGRCSFINRVGAEFLGGEPGDFIGKKIHALIHHGPLAEDRSRAEDCPLCRTFQTGIGHHNTEDRLWRLNHQSFPADIQSFPLMEDDRVTGAIVAFHDLTEKKRIVGDTRAGVDFNYSFKPG
jgi:PAS domain-containing protein